MVQTGLTSFSNIWCETFPFRAGEKVNERKMAENEIEIKVDRKRKSNFSISEMSVITESVRKNLDIIQSKLTNNVTNKKTRHLLPPMRQMISEGRRCHR